VRPLKVRRWTCYFLSGRATGLAGIADGAVIVLLGRKPIDDALRR